MPSQRNGNGKGIGMGRVYVDVEEIARKEGKR